MAFKIEIELPEVIDINYSLAPRLQVYYEGVHMPRVKSLNTVTGDVTLFRLNDPFQRHEVVTKWDLSKVKIEFR